MDWQIRVPVEQYFERMRIEVDQAMRLRPRDAKKDGHTLPSNRSRRAATALPRPGAGDRMAKTFWEKFT